MRRFLSYILALVLLISMIPMSSITAYALDSKVEKAIEWAISIANDNSHGYSQANRTGPDYDCSSFVSTAFKNAGFSVSGSLHTGNLLNAFVSAGFTKYNKGAVSLQRGDILLRPKTSSRGGHTELYIGNNQCVAAHSNKDGKTGDSSGQEIDVRSKNYCTFCKNSDYTYILRYEGSSSSNDYTYSFDFNANGGTLGSSGAFSVSYGEQFQVINTTCVRSGYTWAGWNVKRNNDDKWYVSGQGWCTESQISSNGFIKKVYSNGKTLTLDDSWASGIQGNCSYTFYAVWVQSRANKLEVFLSPYGEGYDHITALNNSTSSGFAQEHIYAWYILYDANTGALLNTYTDKNYSVELAIYDPNGEIVFNHTYTDSNDANWIGVTPQMSGTYTATATISGDFTGSHSTTYQVSYDAELWASPDSVFLNLNGTNSQTIAITPTGGYPGEKNATINYNGSYVSVSSKWSNSQILVTLNGLKVGSTSVRVNLYENYTGNKNVVATITIPVTVTANTYIVSYDANGGSGAPPSQTKYYGTDITLSSTKPVGKTYTVTFDGNGGSTSYSTKTYTQSFSGWNTYKSGAGASYSPGSTFSSNLDVTLYAQWSNPNFSSINAAREGYYFVGWYDSKSTDFAGLPTGKRYTSTTKISSNITLYAMWSKSANLLFGDYNLDGEITYLEDVSALLNLVNGLITTDYPIQEVMFRCDLNRDGELDAVDALMINKLRLGEITQSDLSSVGSKFVGMEIREYPQRDFRYGGELDTEYLSVVAFFENGTAYLIEDNCVVSGYDPYKIGTQTLTVNYYQYSTTYTVTIHPPEYTVHLDANGGTVKYSGYTFTYGEKIGTLVSPERDGYTFLGWTFEETGTNYVKPTDIYSYMSNKTLYAQWTRNSYTVSFNANGGSGAPTSQTKTHDVDLILSSVEPTRAGYKFVGWATSGSATLSSYQSGATFTSNENTTLYAVWEKEIVLSSIAVYGNPSKTIYYIGDSFNTSGLIIKLIYSDGTTENISTGFTISGFESESAGTKTIMVSYGAETTTFDITVETPTIVLSTQSLTMNIGETSTITATTVPSGYSITWISSDSNIATVSSGIITAKATGTVVITAEFTCNGITYAASCTVIVYENIVLGDVNDDGMVDAGDAVLISRYDAGLIALTKKQLEVGDVNNDGVVDAGDAVVISRYDAGFISI